MSQEYIELRGPSAYELRRVDRLLAELSRPALLDDSMAPATRDSLLQLGICVGGDASRMDLVEALWGRKRALMRQMSAIADRGPTRPVA